MGVIDWLEKHGTALFVCYMALPGAILLVLYALGSHGLGILK